MLTPEADGVNMGVGILDSGVARLSVIIEYTIMRAKEAVKRNRRQSLSQEKESIRILQAGLGSLPISNPTWLSAEGPVVSEPPPSARGISKEVLMGNSGEQMDTCPWRPGIYTSRVAIGAR